MTGFKCVVDSLILDANCSYAYTVKAYICFILAAFDYLDIWSDENL